MSFLVDVQLLTIFRTLCKISCDSYDLFNVYHSKPYCTVATGFSIITART